MEVLTLQTILEGFNAPLNEEQAWAVCYQCAGYLRRDWEESPQSVRGFSGIQSVLLAKDGSVSSSASQPSAGKKCSSEYELIQALGVVIFQALDYGLSECEEQQLSASLNELLEQMTGSVGDEEGEDEGIEHDAGEEDNRLTLEAVTKCCEQHLQPPLEAATHYKAVCRALVAEAVELSTFLEKISDDKDKLMQSEHQEDAEDDLQELKRADWARFWMQVMRELRRGAQLKKVHLSSAESVEFELTPYEILMDDIKSRRYTLNKVMVQGNVPPSTKKDAHAVILDFIRSRPPLHPAENRKLKDAPLLKRDPREELMDAIKKEQRLKPTPGRILERSRTAVDERDGGSSGPRKIIKPDMTLFDNSFDEELEDSDEDDVFDERNKVTPSPIGQFTPLSPKSPPAEMTRWQKTTVALDLAGQDAKFSSDPRCKVAVCPSSANQNRHADRKASGHAPSPYFPGIMATDFSYEPDNIQSSLECLSLTIEEVMHIRSVLTKAEQECLLTDPELYSLVAKGKVCFTCKKTRFSFLGPWSTKCKFCQRGVCSDCVSKMRIPTEHFENIPVYTLSPSPMSPRKTSHYFTLIKTGSAPSSPESARRFSPLKTTPQSDSNSSGSQQDATPPATASQSPRRGPLLRSQTVAQKTPPPLTRHKFEDQPLMNICRDCKALVMNIIRASRLSLASAPDMVKNYEECPSRRPSRNFHLDLKPVYKRH